MHRIPRALQACPAVLGLTLLGGAMAACSAPPPPPRPVPQIVGTESCSATVNLRAYGSPGAPAPVVAVQVDSDEGRLVRGERTSPRLDVELPGTLQVEWEATIREAQDGSRTLSRLGLTATGYAFTGGITGTRYRRAYDSGNGRWHSVGCGSETTWTVTLHEERMVRITSDPDGATIYNSPNQWSVPRLVGTTPKDLLILWAPGESRMGLLFRKSGHEDVRQTLERSDSEIRAILHPLPETRP